MIILMSENTDKLNPDTISTLKELFWRNGYAKTSIQDVVQATGHNRYALYNHFGGKRELFLAALDAYYNERKTVFFENLNKPSSAPLDAIRTVFEFAITEMADRGSGCLLCNVANDTAPMDSLVADRISGYLSEMDSALQGALTTAQTRGELNNNITPEDGAAVLVTLTLGLGVQAKRKASIHNMIATFESTMRAISKAQIQ